MKLTNRDVDIINFIDKVKGATIEQIQIMFFPSYDTAKRRLRQLKENNFLKCAIHPVLNKKIYYIKRLPSYHSIIINHVCLLFIKAKEKAERSIITAETTENIPMTAIFVLTVWFILTEHRIRD